jgi:hypothetical protein
MGRVFRFDRDGASAVSTARGGDRCGRLLAGPTMTWLLILILIVFVLAPIAQAYAKRLNAPEAPSMLPGEVARMREEIDQLAAHVNRLQEEQSFMLKLLSEGKKPPLLGGERQRDPSADPGRRRPET